MGYIYKIINNINNKIYIGQTTRPVEHRWKQHIADTFGDNHKKHYLIHQAFIKYGLENFSFSVIEETNNDKLDEREQYWIKYFHTCIYDDLCCGYNLTWGGNGTKTIDSQPIIDLWNQGYSEGEIVKILGYSDITVSAHLKANNISSNEILKRGYKQASNKQSQTIYQYSLDGQFIKEWRSINEACRELKINPSNLGRYLLCLYNHKNGRRSYENFLWVKNKEDINKALNWYQEGQNNKNCSIGQFDLNENLIQIFKTAADAERALGIDASQIRSVCKNKPKYKTAGGFKWKYIYQ